MSAKTVTAPGWREAVFGDPLVSLLDPTALALLVAVMAVSGWAAYMARRI